MYHLNITVINRLRTINFNLELHTIKYYKDFIFIKGLFPNTFATHVTEKISQNGDIPV